MKKVSIPVLFIILLLTPLYSQNVSFNKLIELPGDYLLNIIEQHNGNLLALSYHHFYTSDDNGKTWKQNDLDLNISAFDFPSITNQVVKGEDHIFIINQNELYFSKDLCRTWTKLNIPDLYPDSEIMNLFQDSDGNIFLNIESWEEDVNSLFISKDEGLTYEKIIEIDNYTTSDQIVCQSNGKTFISNEEGFYTFNATDNTLIKLEVPFDFAQGMVEAGGLLFVSSYNSDNELYVSKENGDTWEIIPYLFDKDLEVLELFSDGENLIIQAFSIDVDNEYILKYDFANNKLNIIDSAFRYNIFLLSSGKLFNDNTMYLEVSPDFGKTWQPSFTGMSGRLMWGINYDKAGNYYCTTFMYTAGKFDPAESKYYDLGLDIKGSLTVIGICVCENGNIVLNTGDGVYYSKDNGNTWGETDYDNDGRSFDSMVIIDGIIYLTSYNGTLFASGDNGETAELVKKFDFPVTHFFILDDGKKYITGLKGIYELDKNYNPTLFGFEKENVSFIGKNKKNGKLLVLGRTGYTEYEAHISQYGIDWEDIPVSIDNRGFTHCSSALLENGCFLITNITGIYILPPDKSEFEEVEQFKGIPCFFISETYDGKLIFPAFDGGIYEIISSPTGVDFERIGTVSNNVVPNPANGHIRFTTSIKVGSLLIFDESGSLADEIKFNGTGEIEYKTSALPVGIYHYIISSGKKIERGSFLISR